MKKTAIFSLLTGTVLFALVSCDNDATTSNNADSPAITTPTNDVSTTDWAAKADEMQTRSDAGKYVDVKTGKPVKLSMDRTTGRVMNQENNAPVTRYVYVDNNDWWLMDWEGKQLGKTKWEKNKMWYDDNGNWVDYNTKWKDEDTSMNMNDSKMKTDDDSKMKTDDMKMKTDKDGDTKIKSDGKKIKTGKDSTK